jgi:hypothetical protein
VPLEGGGYEERVTWEEVSSSELPEHHTSWTWEGDTEVTTWSAGPFVYPVEAPPLTRETYTGPSRVFRNGARTHVVWGPWQLVIRGIGAHTDHRVIARWEVFRAWATTGWKEVARLEGSMPGSSDVHLGGSERWGRGGSELRLRGASERFAVGASELRLGGASERVLMGATEVAMRGASERRWGGASELRLGGASEVRLGGGSELRLGGGSEGRLGGGSEPRLAPAAAELEHQSEPIVWPRLSADASK